MYRYVKDYSYLKPRRSHSLRRDIFLLSLGIVLGAYGVVITRTRLAPALISPLPMQSVNNIAVVPTQTSTPTPSLFPTPTLTPTIGVVQKELAKKEYVVALLGDSMIDTAGPSYSALSLNLASYFPQTRFTILNYGLGARDLEYGLSRLTNDYNYLGKDIPALLSQNPDVIIVESFAYNHWSSSKSDLDKQWITLGMIVSTIRERSGAKLAFLATIAPNSSVYAKGIKDISWTDEQRRQQAEEVRMYLNNFVNFATSQNIPLINAYGQSLGQDGEGKLEYINSGDNLHPSEKGHELVADLISLWLKDNL
jgi:hypothetical protein